MNKTLLAWAAALCLSAWASTAERSIHALIPGWDWELYASTFTKDASRAMQWEWEYQNEVCGWIQVSNLPQALQNTIMEVWWDIEMVRECTERAKPMDY